MNNDIQLELHVPDFKTAKEFYGKLGFVEVWKREKGDEGDYMVMKRDNTIVNFWPGNEAVWEQSYFKNFPRDTKRGYGIEIVIPVKNINEFYKNAKTFANIVQELKKRPWGLADFRLEDPFGFYLRITEPHDVTDTKYQVP